MNSDQKSKCHKIIHKEIKPLTKKIGKIKFYKLETTKKILVANFSLLIILIPSSSAEITKIIKSPVLNNNQKEEYTQSNSLTPTIIKIEAQEPYRTVHFNLPSIDKIKYSEKFSASSESEFVRDFGDIYKYENGESLNWIGRIPMTASLSKGKNRFRVVYGLLHYDVEFKAKETSLEVLSFSYGTNSCGDYKEGAVESLNQLAYIMKQKKWNFDQNIATVELPVITGSVEICQYAMVIGSQKRYQLNLTSKPDSANVIIDNKNYGKTPLKLSIKKSSRRLRVTFRKNGYIDSSYEYENQSDIDNNELEFQATLSPIRK